MCSASLGRPSLPHVRSAVWGELEKVQQEDRESCVGCSLQVLASSSSSFLSFSDVCDLFIFSAVAVVNSVDGKIICPT